MKGADKLFDDYAEGYDEALTQAISVSGEDRHYFAKGRINWLGGCLHELGEFPGKLLDFGCGDGSSVPLILDLLQAKSAVGVDISEKSVAIARARYARPEVTFETLPSFKPSGDIDLAYCNGVFHHIPPDERAEALAVVNLAIRTGGLFALWENNPLNPATRYVMSRCPFDEDAQMLTPSRARAMLHAGGFTIVRTDFRFIFPAALRALRKLEDFLHGLPFGTQYQILSRKIR